MNKKKSIALILALVLCLTTVACVQISQNTANSGGNVSVKAGEYSGKAGGFGGEIEVAVTLSEKAIDDIKIVNDYETEGVGRIALEEVKNRILEGQSTKVEAVTGATSSSKGMMNAVRAALDEAQVSDDAFSTDFKLDRKFETEKSADVIIIGGGGAGLSAAVTAMENEASVIVVEKNGFIGGNTILCGGIYNSPDPELQGAQGIEDSPELFYQQTIEGGDNVANPELVKVLTSKAYEGLQWLKDLGMEYEETIIQGAGSLYPRTHQSVDPLGTGFIKAYFKALDGNEKVEILTETTAEDLILEDGKITGVKAKNYDGSDLTLKANKGVIVATGGFSKNIEMVLEYNTSGKWKNLDDKTVSTNLDSIQGDGIKMAKEAGAELVDMEQMQFLYLGIPKIGLISGLVDLGAENTIFVNAEGNRFVREDGRRDLICSAIFEQKDGQMYLLHSSDTINVETAKSLEGVPLKDLLATNQYGWQIGETIEELAEKINVPAENLVKTIEAYNTSIDSQEDGFGRELLTKKMEKGPFVAVPRVPALHHTMGGIKIDTQARVIGVDGNPIPGLYAGGEVTGGIHGANRLGGNAVVDTVVFGRIAGESAAQGK